MLTVVFLVLGIQAEALLQGLLGPARVAGAQEEDQRPAPGPDQDARDLAGEGPEQEDPQEVPQEEAPPDLEILWQTLPLPDLGPEARLGQSMVRADFDGDGQLDLAVSAPGAARASGRGQGLVLVAIANRAGLTAGFSRYLFVAPLSHTPAFESAGFGHSLCVAQLDSDPSAELVIGAPLSGAGSGAVYVWGVEALERPALRILDGSVLPGSLGHSLCTGDLEGDGTVEILVGAPGARTPAGVRSGAVLILSPGKSPRSIYPDHPREDGLFGTSMVLTDLLPGGPLNLVVSAPGEDRAGLKDSGAVHILAPLHHLRRAEILRAPEDLPVEAGFGAGLAALGTLVAIGAPNRDLEGIRDPGAVYLRQSPGRIEELEIPRPWSDGQAGGGLAFTDLGGSAAADLLALTFGSEFDGAQRGAWLFIDHEPPARFLVGPRDGGSHWAQSLVIEEEALGTLILAGDPSFDPKGSGRPANHGRVTWARLPRL